MNTSFTLFRYLFNQHDSVSHRKKYLHGKHPHIWLFNGKEPDECYSVRGLSWVICETLKKTSISKEVNLHSLRQSYVTHLLEEGLNIVTLKELLGHAGITATDLPTWRNVRKSGHTARQTPC
ncbi:MAG TPA: tyrosine-type recombinase/integrase [Prolixibacteraceae bacterium]|nr:tyrosine-type recombinase/integrase [Prolixibacteraceae bacterium]